MHKSSNVACQHVKELHAASQASSNSDDSSVNASNLSEPTNSIPDAIKTNPSKSTCFEHKEKKRHDHRETVSKRKEITLSTKHVITPNMLSRNSKTTELFRCLCVKHKQK